MGLTHAPHIQGHNPILALKPWATNGPEEMPAVATSTIPPSQEGGFVRVEEAAVTGMPRVALGECRALEVSPHGTPTEPDLMCHRVQRPPLPMVGPDLLVGHHPLRPPRGGEGRRPWGRLRGRERHSGDAEASGSRGGIVQRRGRGGGLGIDPRELRSVSPEYVGQHVCKILQQVEPIGHLEGLGCPEARRFRIGLGAIPHDYLDPGMSLKPLGDGRGLPVGEQGQGPSPFQIQ